MQDLEKLKEIEELGLEEPDSPEPQEPEGRGGSNVPLVQGALCLLVLGALLLLQYLEAPAYDTFTAWYQQEASQEIQLPADAGELPGAGALCVFLAHKVQFHTAVDTDYPFHPADTLRRVDVIHISRAEEHRFLIKPVIKLL